MTTCEVYSEILASKPTNFRVNTKDKNMPNKRYNIILADPPSKFSGGGDRLAINHYPVMTDKDLRALPVADIAAPDCILFLWTSGPFLKKAIQLGEAWGFKFKSWAFIWVKETKHGKDHVGMGYLTQSNPEVVLYFSKGRPKRVTKNVRCLQRAKMGRHSEKPFLFHEKIVELMGDVPRAELFARVPRDGWDCYGNEIDGLDIREALANVISGE